MVHIVQAVLSGRAEIPKLFIDEALAEAAYVDYANEYWAQSYPAFCEKSGISRDCYSSASAFIRSFDVVDKNTINYWSVKPEAPTESCTGCLCRGQIKYANTLMLCLGVKLPLISIDRQKLDLLMIILEINCLSS